MAACGLGKDGRRSTCAACVLYHQRGAAAAARRRGHKSRRRAPPPAIRACARRRRASGRARGRRGSSLLSERGFLASRRRRREAARSRASWRCPEHRLPASIACARQTSWGGCSSRAAVGRGLLGCLSGSFQGRSQVDALQKPRTTFKAAADESKRVESTHQSSSTATTNATDDSVATRPRLPRETRRLSDDHEEGKQKSTTQILSPRSPTSAP